MKQRSYKLEAIILARRNIGEADRLLTIFSEQQGKLRVIAKGVRRPTSRKRGSVELFNQVSIFLARGKTFNIITEVEVKNNFNEWRKDLAKVGIAYHLAEVVNKLTREEQEQKKVYEILESAFNYLTKIDYSRMAEFVIRFKKAILTDLGFLHPSAPIESGQADVDATIENLIQARLRTRRFLKFLN
ncbi:DNA repair protein RecO [Candidatus Microgenomates bacterium]|nr:DNA repair protein RecO [Candidatus Microgenomates bacterium]